MLSNYQQDGKALLQSFLLGQPELKDTLQRNDMEQVRQRIIAGYHLRPLNRDELQAYVEHRLEVVGWARDPEITDAAFDAPPPPHASNEDTIAVTRICLMQQSIR